MATEQNQMLEGAIIHRNGDRAVKFGTMAKLKKLHSGLQDLSTVDETFNFDQQQHHLGMLYTFDMIGTQMRRTNTVPRLMERMLQQNAVIQLEGDTRFTYSTPVLEYDYIKVNMTTPAEELGDKPGLGGSPFYLYLNKAMRQGDVLSYDVQDGIQIIVSEDDDIEQVADSFRHTVKIAQGSGELWYPADKLISGTQYFKKMHSMGEFSEEYSEFNFEYAANELVQEFTLGNHMGVSVGTTLYGGEKRAGGLNMHDRQALDKIMNDVNLFRDSTNQPYDVLFNLNYVEGETYVPGQGWNIMNDSTSVMSIYEAMAVAELSRMEVIGMLWAKAAFITEIKGHKIINEGLYDQFKRGQVFAYSRPGGLELSDLTRFSDALFANTDIPVEDRRFHLWVGKGLKDNLDALIQMHALSVLTSPIYNSLLGSDTRIPGNVVSGSDLRNLQLNEVRFAQANLPGVGMVTYDHDPSLDYSFGSDRLSMSQYGSGLRARTTYSGYLDARESTSSNVNRDVTIQRDRNVNVLGGDDVFSQNSIFYVRPSRSLHWGWENGRMNSISNLTGFAQYMSSRKSMSTEFWMHARSAAWVSDKSSIFLLELEVPRATYIQ